MKKMTTQQTPTSHPEHLDENELAQYADYLRHESGEVTDEMIDHVAACNYCRAEIMAITDLLDKLPDLAEEPADSGSSYQTADSTDKQMVTVPGRIAGYKWLRAAAAIAALVLITWGVEKIIPDHPRRQPLAVSGLKNATLSMDSLSPNNKITNPQATGLSIAEPLTAKNAAVGSYSISGLVADTIRYASAFVPSPTYEGLIGAKYRSGNDPKVSGPDVGSVFAPGDTLKVFWTPDQEDHYIILIFDNQGNPVKEVRPGMVASFVLKLDFEPGLYYWKFTGKEEIWKLGKFKVIGVK
jgi:hypothetical protein